MSGGTGSPRRVVIAALLSNLGIALAKLVAALITGSATMLAEAVHSLADTTNQGLLLLGLTLSGKSDPEKYPLGRSGESYFWAFIVSLMLFFGGGVFAVYEGVHKFGEQDHSPSSPIVGLVVLLVSLGLEAGSFVVAIREFNKTRGSRKLSQALFNVKDPTIPVVLLEDTGAVLGLFIALIALAVSWVTGSALPDAIGSIFIGLLLCAIGILLARDTRSLLLGESATPEMRARVLELVRSTEGIEDVRQLLTMHLGPESVILALKVRFRSGMTVEEAERVTDELEERVRAELPQMTSIFVEPDSDYDAKLDPAGQALPT
jgi:cation diffusion facilitator family transporter